MFFQIRKLTFREQLVGAFVFNFMVGAVGEFIALKTGAYDVIVANKAERRYLIDKKVYELRKDIEKWEEEDARIAERRKEIIW